MSNIFFVKDSTVVTPRENGSFLAGITRQRTMSLLRNAGISVVERDVEFAELLNADEIFSTGNQDKVRPVIRMEERSLDVGPVTIEARRLYRAFASSAEL